MEQIEEITLKAIIPYENGNYGNQKELEWANSQPYPITIVPESPIEIIDDGILVTIRTVPEQMEIIKQNPRYEFVEDLEAVEFLNEV